MRRGWLSFVAVAAVISGCMLAPGYVPPADLREIQAQQAATGNRFKVTVVSASIAHLDPNGQPWHREEPSGFLAFLGGLAGSSLGGPPGALLGRAVGEILEGGEKIYPPAVFVQMRVGGALFETVPSASFSPTWRYSFAVDIRGNAPETTVLITLKDAENGRTIGEREMTMGELLGHEGHVLDIGPSVSGAQLSVEPLGDLGETRRYSFSVPADKKLTELGKMMVTGPRFDGDWQGVALLNGDVVRIRASGTIFPRDAVFHGDVSCGPEGLVSDPGMRKHNYPEFREMAHASLIGVSGRKFIAVGRETTFTVDVASTLILGVNDPGAGDNRGSFLVEVEVNPPDLLKLRGPTSGRVAPAWK